MTFKLIARPVLLPCLSSSLLYVALSNPAAAISSHVVESADGAPFITLRFFDVGDGPYAAGPASTWNLSDQHKAQLIAATHYWSEIIQPVTGKNPAILNVGTATGNWGGSASSHNATMQDGAPTTVQAALTDQYYTNLSYGAHGAITVTDKVGTMDWSAAPYTPSHIALSSETSLSTVMIHEIAHALGVASNAFSVIDQNNNRVAGFGDSNYYGFDAWSMHLRDDNDNPARAGQYINCNGCYVPAGEDAFDVRNDQAYFTGSHVSDVLNGAMKGLPMRIGTDYGPYDQPFFSHIELKNGLMSHQYYRNYTTLMEAELAALQDIGYTIDRRNFYGSSVYGDGQTLTNNNPYFGRNATGTDYLANTYNSATLGLGLHVYGSHNSITQNADLLSAGAGGGGIRVDGEGNNLKIAPGVRVYADGENGRAVMFAYGKDHTLTHRGDVQALGDNGIAVSFDFGHNSRGDATGYRGSYILSTYDSTPQKDAQIWSELNGALVSSFDLTGRVAGKKAAIFMSENAYVEDINVMQGAHISGDIISDYSELDDNHNLRLTQLRFGLEADEEGRATHHADANFAIGYAGNIVGQNISFQALGGTSVLTGNHDLFEVLVDRNATLAGRGEYTIATNRYFNNRGTLFVPQVGDAITVHGNYDQTAAGTLQVAFNNQQQISSLIVNGRADIDGSIMFTPEQGYYHNGFTVTSDQWLQANAINGGFTDMSTAIVSPTLTATTTDNGQNSYTVALGRQEDAYSHYADGQNAQAVGVALYGVANSETPELQGLITMLDFSAIDGSDIRAALPQLSSEAYASAQGVLMQDSAATRNAANNRLQQAFGPEFSVAVAQASKDASGTAAWVSMHNRWNKQSGNSNTARTTSTLDGFTMGVDTSLNQNWRLGVLAGYGHSSFKIRDRAASGSSNTYSLGAYAGSEWEVAGGALGLRSGLAYAWHDVDMKRSVAFAGFSDSLSADYKAGTFQVFGEVGYKLNVSQSTVVEPYASVAYVRLHTDGFDEKGKNGVALAVNSATMDTTLSTLGVRVAGSMDLGNAAVTARADLGWRHASGDVIPTSTASFVAGSNNFVALGNSIGKDTALVETGFDVALSKNAKFGVSYQGQFGSGLNQNGVNAHVNVRF
ncbi:autotransporter outer membrane beta-barrel domain-containing protein [Paenalcaligenes suwonensis]|uniref:autotransporter family protein n=1 Tax=Paenalcaligenes suwonensis TaxID=1202713 RepID=UPI001A99D9FB|nr:autotransporter outer membrane beta-barrel domain-containing protein [Paenalcaligenes suwonensis]